MANNRVRGAAGADEEGMSDRLIVGLILAYAVICAVSLYEKNYNRLLYWIGAILIQLSVLKMR